MPPVAKVLQGADQWAKLVKAIAENNHHATAFELAGQFVPKRRHARFAAWLGVLQGLQDVQQVLGVGSGR